MNLELLYQKVVEIYNVGKKLGIPEDVIGKLDILEANFISNKLENVNFKLDMATEVGIRNRFILISRLSNLLPMKLEELVVCFNNIRLNGNSQSFKDASIGKWKICEPSEDKTKLEEITMDLELVRVEGQKTFFVQKTEIYKSGLLKVVN